MLNSTLLDPAAVCIVGASADRTRLAGRVLTRLLQHGYPGDIYLVNPNHDEIDGRPCYPSVEQLPAACDVALICVRASKVPDVITECGARGVPTGVVLSSGFEEDASATDLVNSLKEAASIHDVTVLGPNCEGVWSVPARMTLTFGSAADRSTLIPGPVSVISQSGSIGGACMRELQNRGVGCRYFVSTGNETVTSAMDVLDLLIAEGGSKVIAMFLEGLSDGSRLQELARRARGQGISLITLRGGISAKGRLASLTHTGKMASAQRVYADVFRQAQILDIETFGQLLDAIEVGVDPANTVVSNGATGLGVIAISGGSRALLADACAERDVPLAEFDTTTEERLAATLPKFGSPKNPTDVTGDVLSDPELFTRAADLVAADPKTDSVLVQYANGAEAQIGRHVEVVTDLRTKHAKPFVFSFLGDLSPELAALLQHQGIHYANDPAGAITRVSWMRYLGSRSEGTEDASSNPPAVERVRRPATNGWADSCQFLDDAGIAMASWSVVHDVVDELPAGLRFPVVVKALPEHSAHKTEGGLVVLDISDHVQLAKATEEVRRRLGQQAPLLLQEMVPDALELLLGVVVDPDFGPVLAIGFGGVLTEWVDDIGYVQLPATRADIESTLRRLRVWRLLQPFRGRPGRDIDAVLTTAERLSRAYLATGDSNWEIEVNPALVLERGLLVADVLCTSAGRESDQD